MGNIKSLIYCILHKIKSITKYLYLNFKCILECGAHIATILVAIIAIITLWKNIDSIKDFFEISNLKNTISRLNYENSRLKNDISNKNDIMTFYDIEINTKEKEIEEKIKKIENLNEDIKRHEYTRDKLISNNIFLER